MPTDNDAREDQMLEASVREFAARELLPHLAENDRYPLSGFFSAAIRKAMELEYFNVMLPEDMNGWNGKILPLGLILKNIAEVDGGMAAILLTNAVAQEVLSAADEGGLLREMAGGARTPRESLMAFPLLTDPSEDEILPAAENVDGRFFLSGQAEYLVMGHLARRALLPARIGTDSGFAYFLVDLDQPGIKKVEPIFSMGLKACPAADVMLDRAEGRLVGRIDEGPEYFGKVTARMLPAAAAVALGLMQGSLKEALQYSKKRRQGGRRILDWSELRMIMADMALKAKTGQMLLDQALRAADANDAKWADDAYAAAIYILEAACDLTSNGIQALGGYGYTKHHFQERRFRDARHLRSVFGSENPRRLNFVKLCLNW